MPARERREWAWMSADVWVIEDDDPNSRGGLARDAVPRVRHSGGTPRPDQTKEIAPPHADAHP
ncbi:MAG TPA: hypothetical protein PL064_04750 [Thermogutta sp.]|nr:hypothetical protein [Thermogutta sp.]HQF12511.1 hypothetical protein [Thermogutta sp.]